MHLFPPILLTLLSLLSPTLATTTAQPPLKTATLHHLSPTPKPLATLSFSPQHPHLSKLESFTPPPNSTSLTRIGVPLGSKSYRTTLTATSSFHAPYVGRFRITVTPEGEVLGASFHASLRNGEKEAGVGEERGDFDMLVVEKGPEIVGLEPEKKAGVQGKDGEEVEEKTFLQK